MKVSVIIVVKNEEQHILNCIKSVESQFDNYNDWELIIVDGNSNDSTLNIARQYLHTKNYQYKILQNPKGILASGWNIGITNSEGQFVVRPDAHAELQQGYIQKGIEILNSDSSITAVGGILITKSKSRIGYVIKEALSSKIGVGSSFRSNSKSGFADTVVYGIYRREVFNKVGLFDENLIRHQDNDLHKRIKINKGKFWQESSMKAIYYCRDSIRSLNKQIFHIGLNLPVVILRKAVSVRNIVPALFYIVLLILFFLGLFNSVFFIFFTMLFGTYIFILLFESVRRIIKFNKLAYGMFCIIVFNMHFLYALGTIIGFINLIKLNFRK